MKSLTQLLKPFNKSVYKWALFSILLILIIYLVIYILPIQTSEKKKENSFQIELNGEWQIKLEDKLKYKTPGDNKWDNVYLPGSILNYVYKKTGNTSGICNLRKEILIPHNMKQTDLALIIGRIGNADKTYFNGTFIGSMGQFPPDEKSMWNHPRHYKIPSHLIRYGEKNTITIRLSYLGFGDILGTFKITDYSAMVHHKESSNLLRILSGYGVIFMGLPVFIIFLIFFIRRPSSHEYLFFTLVLFFGIFILLELYTDNTIFTSTLNRLKSLGVAWAAMVTMHPLFLHRFFKLKRKKIELVLWSTLALIIIICIFWTNESNLRINSIILIFVGIIIGIYNISCDLYVLYKNRPYAKLFSFIDITGIIAAMHDAIVYFAKFTGLEITFLGYSFHNMIFHYKAIALFVSMSLVLIFRFIDTLEQVEDLNTNLENILIEKSLLHNKLEESKTKRSVISAETEKKIDKVIIYIKNNYESDISREGLAATVNVHPDNLSRIFNSYTGKRLGEYINELRIKDAAQKLKETDRKIIDIAYSVGFDNLRTFNNLFPQIMNMTPNKYRKKYRNN